MQLLENIINVLVDGNTTLTSPLLKTKVLADRIGNSVLLNWVNSELIGYGGEADLPKYRIFGASVYGTYIMNGF